MYLQDRIDALRKDIDKHGKVKVKKGQQAPPAAKVFPLGFHALQSFPSPSHLSPFPSSPSLVLLICLSWHNL